MTDAMKEVPIKYTFFRPIALCFGVCLFLSLHAVADGLPVEVKGRWLPGAMLQGQTLPGAKLRILDTAFTADANGLFVFGLGRDAAGSVTLKVAQGGLHATKVFTVLKREYDLQRIDGVAKRYVSPPQEVLARISREAAQVRKARATHSSELFFRQSFVWPAEGPVTGVYGSQRVFNGVPKRPHFGLDIGGPVGTPVMAPAGGVVTLVVDDMYYSGGTLIVDHGYGISSTFIHLSKILVEEGQRIQQGQQIAKMGASGRATGSHLDWRVNWFEHRLDPQLLIPERP